MTAVPKPAAYQTFTVEFEDEVAEKLVGVAEERGTTVEELIVSAAHDYAANGFGAYDNWSSEDIEAIEEGIAQLRRGEKVPHEEVMAKIRAKHGW